MFLIFHSKRDANGRSNSMGGYILVVEDDAALLDAIEEELTGRGYSVRTAGNGVEGLQHLRRELPMLIITDLAMPVMNGAKMLQALRAEPLGREVPVIILSAYGYEWEAELMQAQGYIKKPVRAAHLEQEIARVLAGLPRRQSAMLN